MLRDGAIATWSSVVHSPDELHAQAREAISRAFASFPYCVLSPAFACNYGKSRATCLCLDDEKIAVIPAEAQGAQPALIPLAAIDALETGTELLCSWITIHFQDRRVSVFFNTVSKPLYAPFIDAFRARQESERDTPALPAENQESIERYFATVYQTDFKYATYSRLVLGNRLPTALLYHPTSSIGRSLFGTRVISSYVLIAAGRMLHVLSEGKMLRYSLAARYAMIIRHIPIDAALQWHQGKAMERYSIQALERSSHLLLELPVAHTESEKFSEFCAACSIA